MKENRRQVIKTPNLVQKVVKLAGNLLIININKYSNTKPGLPIETKNMIRVPYIRINRGLNKPTTMTKARFAFPYLAIIAALIFSFNTSKAQTSESPLMAGLSGIFLDYQGMLTGDVTQIKTFDPGITFGAHVYVTDWLNASLNSAFVPEATYPIGENQFISTSLIDVNTMVQLKSNGTFLKEDAFLAPYITTGFGLNTASNNVRLYIPAGLGLKVQVTPNFSFAFESIYKQRLGKEKYQHFSHSIGFVFALPSNRKPVKEDKKKEETFEEKPQVADNALVDTDQDGVPDRDDLCPEVKGKAHYLGCPEEEKQESPSDKTDVAVNKPKPTPITPIGSDKRKPAETEPTGSTNSPEVVDMPEATQEPFKEISSEDLRYLEHAMANIYFEPASDELTFDSYGVLDTVAMILERNPNYDLQVMGHTDNLGDQNTNLVLSIKRAFKVKYYLVYEKDVRLSRITSDGYSSVAPVADNSTEEGRAKNRRVEFKLMKSQSNKLGYNQTSSY